MVLTSAHRVIVTGMVNLAAAWFMMAAPAYAQEDSKFLAPGFKTRPAASKLVIVPADIEMFSISAGGVSEPRADWTDLAGANLKAALAASQDKLGANVQPFDLKDLDELAEISALHGAVAQAVFVHHAMGVIKLPTKHGKLDWSMGDAVLPLKEKTGADYALFTWIRDSYASPERKAAMIALAMVGVGLGGGQQIGYASLVDLNTGRIVWFNDLRRATGDLREAKPAMETVEALLRGFPVTK